MPEPVWEVLDGDCMELMRGLSDASVDSVVCDPPYGLEFMGREWDRFKPADARLRTRTDGRTNGAQKSVVTTPEAYRAGRPFQVWCESWAREALRVLKPGGYLVAFGGTRTYHRMACGVEDAGFEVRDQLQWLHGQGFPKSLDVQKVLEAQAAALARRWWSAPVAEWDALEALMPDLDAACDGARGWGTALKPAHEPIVLARKPLGAGTVAGNVLQHGPGAINVDGCRIGGEPWKAHRATGLGSVKFFTEGETPEVDKAPHEGGRWPANVILGHAEGCVRVGTRRVRTSAITKGYERANQGGYTGPLPLEASTVDHADADGMEEVESWECVEGCPLRMLDEQSGARRAAGNYVKGNGAQGAKAGPASIPIDGLLSATYADAGGASRFFYTAKASGAERNAGLSGFAAEFAPTMNNGIGGKPHARPCTCETAGAVPATSAKSSQPSDDAARICATCGGVRPGDAVAPKRNTHPT